jgi:type 1 fimbriae regulatory protein FimB
MDFSLPRPPVSGRPKARKYTETTVQYLNEDELAALFRSIDSPRDLAIFEVAFHRGLRASEVGLLKLTNLRLSAKRLYVQRLKGGNSGEYLLTDREVRALRKWLALRGHDPGPLFLSRNHRPISRQRLDELMRRYGAIAGLPPEKRHFHCLRHSAGTLLGELADAVEVQDHLGHRDIRSTMKYLKVRNKRRTELGERLARQW